MKTRHMHLAVAFVAVLMMTGMAAATELIWVPINPSFGGYAGNATWLMASAQAQNDHVEKTAGYTRADPFDDFEYTLKRSYLSALSRAIIEEAFGDEGLLPEGETEAHYTLGDYQIDISTNGVMTVSITDLLTGDTTTVELPYFSY